MGMRRPVARELGTALVVVSGSQAGPRKAWLDWFPSVQQDSPSPFTNVPFSLVQAEWVLFLSAKRAFTVTSTCPSQGAWRGTQDPRCSGVTRLAPAFCLDPCEDKPLFAPSRKGLQTRPSVLPSSEFPVSQCMKPRRQQHCLG